MIETLKPIVLGVLRVPAEPTPPAGAPESVRTFRASRRFYYLNLIRWGIGQSVTLLGIGIFLASEGFFDFGHAEAPLLALEILGVAAFFLQLPFGFLVIRFDYDMRWYIVTDRSLRIRYGLFRVREMTMTFANIQQITIRQGPLQRLLRISDLEVHTAGGGTPSPHEGGHATKESGHLGYFRGVENAEDIRDLILKRLRRWRDTGLGDPDETAHEESEDEQSQSSLSDAVIAAKAVLKEAQALGEAVRNPP